MLIFVVFSHDSPSAGRKWKGLYRKDNPQFETVEPLLPTLRLIVSDQSYRFKEPATKTTLFSAGFLVLPLQRKIFAIKKYAPKIYAFPV